jgi:hypothetical protein
MDTELPTASIRDVLAQFSDYVTVASWAQSSLAFCYQEGILDQSALNIEPSKEILRCEIARCCQHADASQSHIGRKRHVVEKEQVEVIVPLLIAARLHPLSTSAATPPAQEAGACRQRPLRTVAEVMADMTDTSEALPTAEPDRRIPPAPSDAAEPTEESQSSAGPADEPETTGTPEPAPIPAATPEETPAPTMEINPETGKDNYLTDPVPSGRPLPVEPQEVVIGTKAYTCTLSICCSTILDNMELCDPERWSW